MLEEFKKFALRGNAVDLAMGEIDLVDALALLLQDRALGAVFGCVDQKALARISAMRHARQQPLNCGSRQPPTALMLAGEASRARPQA